MFHTVVASEEQQMFAVVGTLLQFASTPEQSHSRIAVMRAGIPAGAVIPLHSHADPEIFCILTGFMEVFQDDGESQGWATAGPGDVVTIASGNRHAIRNTGSTNVACILVSEDKLYRFFRELGIPIERGSDVPAPSEDVMMELFQTAARYGYWIGSPEDNEAIGLHLGDM